jgi:hypothetical protein
MAAPTARTAALRHSRHTADGCALAPSTATQELTSVNNSKSSQVHRRGCVSTDHTPICWFHHLPFNVLSSDVAVCCALCVTVRQTIQHITTVLSLPSLLHCCCADMCTGQAITPARNHGGLWGPILQAGTPQGNSTAQHSTAQHSTPRSPQRCTGMHSMAHHETAWPEQSQQLGGSQPS